MTRKGKKSARPRKRNLLREYGEAIFVAGVLFIFLRTFVIQAFTIPSGSMEDTLLIGDFLVANKFMYGARIPGTDVRLPKIRDPRPGDIIVFRAPHEEKDFIKRCVAVAGDTVELRENTLYVNGEPAEEPFVALKEWTYPPRSDWGPMVVPEDHLFMLGDNRNNSQDSRYWGFLEKGRVKGLAMVLYFSWDRDGKLPRFPRFFRPIH